MADALRGLYGVESQAPATTAPTLKPSASEPPASGAA
jgi:hypothetical protein